MDISSYSDDNKENNQVIFTPTDHIREPSSFAVEPTEPTVSEGDETPESDEETAEE